MVAGGRGHFRGSLSYNATLRFISIKQFKEPLCVVRL
jgi:hypothetical protein